LLEINRSDKITVFITSHLLKDIGELLALLETAAPADARLLLIGDGPARAELESEAAARGRPSASTFRQRTLRRQSARSTVPV